MKGLRKPRFFAVLLTFVLLLAAIPSIAAGQTGAAAQSNAPVAAPRQPDDNTARSYRVNKVFTQEDRSAIARIGAAIDEVGSDYVIVSATPQEIRRIRARGFQVEELAMALDFPPADSAYHN